MHGWLPILLLAATSHPAGAPAGPALDGFLRQRVGFVIYAPFDGGGIPGGADWILDREIDFFESFVWRESGRRLFVEPVILRPGRQLAEEEYLDAGRWGYLPDFSPRIESDLREAGWTRDDFSALVILYEPADGRDTPLAGATYLPAGLSSIPLRPETFLNRGRRHPLHRLLVHEYLHQMEFAFSGTSAGPYLLDPDTADWEACSPEARDELQVALRRNATCNEIEWLLINPDRGVWTGR